MNQFLSGRFSEQVRRLALGLEPLDAGRAGRVANVLALTFDSAFGGLERSRLERHDSCLYAIRYYGSIPDAVELVQNFGGGRSSIKPLRIPTHPGIGHAIDLRVVDPARRFVPRRFRVRVLTAADAEGQSYFSRVRRPALFPGAAYDVSATATGLRGRVVRGGVPMRWSRVEAKLPSSDVLVGRAHGDDRGEFLLLINSGAIPVGDLEDPLQIRVTVFGPEVAPIPTSPDQPALDPLWDLPLETTSAPGDTDPVSAGETLPEGYSGTSSSSIIDFSLGRLMSGVAEFVI
jgi:hypothetical protein